MTSSPHVDNVIVVVVDALRADRIGAYGSNRGLTPTLDALAEDSIVFEQAFSCINTTDPSITSIHTGKHPRSTVTHHGGLVTDGEKQRIEAAEYVPELLSNAGVQTVATGRVIGRWHHRGFSEYSWSRVGASEVKISQALQNIHPTLHRVVAGCYNAVSGIVKGVTDDDGSDAIEDVLSSMGGEQFYGFVHLMDTHAWYEGDSGLIDELLEMNDYPDGDLEEFFEEYSESPIVRKLLEPNVTKADYDAGLARLFARYDASVRQADCKLKRLINGLKEQGNWENTALFVLSDHGESLHEHGIYFDHHGLYEQTIQVPLIAHIPETPSSRVDNFVQLHDLAPTVLDLLGVGGLNRDDSRSLIGYLLPERELPEPREHIVMEEAHTQRRRGIRTNQYKYIEHADDEVVSDFWNTNSIECGYCKRKHGDTVELYDLHEDPEESYNLASERQQLVEELREELSEHLESLSTVAAGDEKVSYEDEEQVMDRLADLGYR